MPLAFAEMIRKTVPHMCRKLEVTAMRLIDADTAAAFAENCGATFVAESLIFEYRRERKEYLWWKEHVKGSLYADDHD